MLALFFLIIKQSTRTTYCWISILNACLGHLVHRFYNLVNMNRNSLDSFDICICTLNMYVFIAVFLLPKIQLKSKLFEKWDKVSGKHKK